MVSANGTHHNGTNGHYLNCASDYEPAPVIDVTPAAPKPGWRDQFPTYTHNLSWVDSDSLSHSMTLRSDSLSDLMADLRLVKPMIRQSKQKAAEHAPQQAEGASETEQSDVQQCRIHKVDMVRRWSKRTGGHYWAHKAPNGDFCYGRERKA